MKQTFLGMMAIVAVTMAGNATPILDETFSYSDGSLTTVSSGAWATHSGTSGDILVSSGKISLSQSKTEDVNRSLPGGAYNSGTLYVSFKINLSTLPSGSGNYFAHFKDNGTSNFRARIYATTSGAAGGQYRIGVANGASTVNVILPTDLALNTEYTVVVRYNASAPVASTIWVNPTTEADLAVTAADSSSVLGITTYAFRQSNSGGGMGIMTLDDLKVGTAFADVVVSDPEQHPPVISSIGNQSTSEGTAVGPISFTVSDTETAAGNLVLSSSSSNPGLIPTSNIVFGGSGSDRNVTITPVPGQSGTANVTITVTDEGNLTASASFSVNVTAGNSVPVISSIGWTNTLVNVPMMDIPFTVIDGETPGAALTVTASSSDTNLLPNAGIVLGGADNNRLISLTPSNGQTGVSVVTVTASDGTNSANTAFALMVVPSTDTVLNDFFTYADGSVNTSSALLWNTHSGTTGQVQVVGGQLQVLATQSEDINAPLIGAPFTTGSGRILYSSFKANFFALPTTAAGEYFAHFKDASTGFKARVRAGTANAAPGTFRLGIANSTANSTQLPIDLNPGTTYTVITRYDLDAGTSTLWVNPASESDAVNSVTATDAIGTGSVLSYAFREATGFGGVAVDDVKVGSTFAAVFGSDVPPVNPPTLAIVKVGNDLQISWNADSTGFQLESTADLSNPTWVPVVETPAVIDTNKVVTVGAPVGNVFYRLKK